MFYGYGQTNIIPATVGGAAQVLCQAMGGQWRPDAQECQTGDRTYTLPDFLPGSMPSGACPGGEVMTPAGCKPIPPGVESECPPGWKMTPQGCIPCMPGDSDSQCWAAAAAACKAQGGNYDPATTQCKMPAPPPNGQPEPATPSWLLPAVVGGIAAIAVIALVATK